MTGGDNRSWADQFRAQGEKWSDLESAASLLENMKSVVMAQKQSALGDIPVSHAEKTVKASAEGEEYVRSCEEARHQANLAKIELEYMRMKFQEWSSDQANQRQELKMTMGGG